MAFSAFTVLCNKNLCRVPKHFHPPKGDHPIPTEHSLPITTSPSSWQPPICTPSLWVYLFWILLYICGVIQHETSCLWIFSLNTFLRFLHPLILNGFSNSDTSWGFYYFPAYLQLFFTPHSVLLMVWIIPSPKWGWSCFLQRRVSFNFLVVSKSKCRRIE